jgi:restriction system protein
MAQPEFASWINPLLAALKELGGSARPQEVVDLVAKTCSVADAVLDQTISGGTSRFGNQVHWARYYLAEAGLIDRSRRGVWKLTEDARTRYPLASDEIDALVLRVQEADRQVRAQIAAASPAKPTAVASNAATVAIPDANAPVDDSASHAEKLLDLLKSLPPAGFERLCQRLLREAGFEKVEVTGRSGDGGIDGNGVLALNAFVSFRVLFQCKRYRDSVGPGYIRDFRGAMQGRADKGIVLTTGTFTADARREAIRDGVPPIELVDGEKLVQLFEDLELGLIPRKAFELNERFFEEYKK